MSEDLDSLEMNLTQRMSEALASKEYDRLAKLNSLAMKLTSIRLQIAEIEAALAGQAGGDHFLQESSLSGCDIEVSQGDVNQNFFRTTILRKFNLIPPEGTEFTVKALTPRGELSFKTEIDRVTHSRLKARSEIGQFYREAGIRAGDFVCWEKIDDLTYGLRKVHMQRFSRTQSVTEGTDLSQQR